jgi:DNA-binding CsgD family transcriptional regulator
LGRVDGRRKDGSKVSISTLMVPIRPPGGASMHFIAIGEGATDLDPPDFIVVIDREGALVFTTGSVAGIPLENTMRSSILDAVLEHERPRLRDYIDTVVATGEAISFQMDGVGPHGSTSRYSVRLGPIKRGRSVVALSLVSTDLTRRAQAAEPVPASDGARPVHAAGRSPEELAASHDLTAREMEVLALLAQGLTDRQLADSFGLSRRTIGHHVSHILRKLGVPNRTAAALAAREAGLGAERQQARR